MFSRSHLRATMHKISGPSRIVFVLLSGILIGSTATIFTTALNKLTISIPTFGGTYVEALTEPPTLINPVIALKDNDRLATSLVYAGLVRKDIKGSYSFDHAQNLEISNEGKTYTFTLKPNLEFHNGDPLTTEDVAFTIKLIQSPLVRSPYRIDWNNITTEIIDEKTITFTLPEAYAGFLSNLTIGILPKKLWQDIPVDEIHLSDLNLNPIGSGPYKIKSNHTRKKSGKLTFSAFKKFILGSPFIKTITLKTYTDVGQLILDLDNGKIDGISSISAEGLSLANKNSHNVYQENLARIFGLFFNKNKKPFLADKNVLALINASIDRKKLIDQVFSGAAHPTTSVVPGLETKTNNPDIESIKDNLAKDGWQINPINGIYTKKINGIDQPLQWTISVPSGSDLENAARVISSQLKTNGIDAIISPIDKTDFSDFAIRNRDFEALLFGISFVHDTNIYAYLHSSQTEDPGLNITGFKNEQVDSLLEKSLSEISDTNRFSIYQEINSIILEEAPIIFLYQPKLLYIIDKKIRGVSFVPLVNPNERFIAIFDWHIEKRRILPKFIPSKN